MSGELGDCPHTISGKWPNPELTKIIEDSLSEPNPKCPKCQVEGVQAGGAQAHWIECPQCDKQIGEMHFD